MEVAVSRGATDLVMPDAARIGGVTGWQQAAAIAAVHGIESSRHLLPEIRAHLMAATPTAHGLAYVDWANGIQIGSESCGERVLQYVYVTVVAGQVNKTSM